jgi:uncharacterized lipoprotein YmbA
LRAATGGRTARVMGCLAVRVWRDVPCPLVVGGALVMIAAVFFSGCSVLSPKQDRTRFILLATGTPSPAKSGQPTANPNSAPVAIGLGPVQFPEFLDRPELVIRTSPNGFELSETDRWAEPLSDNFRHVLANHLVNLLGISNVVQFPWDPGTRLDYIVRVQVQGFESDTARNAQLVAHWELRTPQGDQILASREARISHPAASLSGDDVAAALSDDVADLAGQIVSTIAQFEQQHVARAPR